MNNQFISVVYEKPRPSDQPGFFMAVLFLLLRCSWQLSVFDFP